MLLTPHQSRGMTLVEIMVAMAIGALLLSGIIQVFTTLNSTSRLSNSLSEIQESARIALNIITKDIRLVGYKGCADPALLENITIIATNPPTTNLNASSIQGWEVDTKTGWSSGAHLDIEGSDPEDAITNSDVITIQRASTTSMQLTGNMTADNANIQTADNSGNIAAGDAVLISDCESADLFRATSASSGTGTVTFAHSTGNNTTNRLSKAYGTDATIMKFINNTYFVADTGRNTKTGDNVLALFRKDQAGTVSEIVEGVENIQVQFGEELTTGNIRYADADNTVTPANITTVKVTLLVASHNRVLEADDEFEYPMVSGKATRTGHSSAGATTFPNDRRLRQTFTSTIKLRNRRVNE